MSFSIEHSAEQIVDPRTKTYFREVLSSYTAGNYRSAVVMLWSVIICDLLFKLEDLKSRGDLAAQQIADEIDAKRKPNPNSPEWELLLVDKVREKTQLLEVSELINLKSIQTHRHLSAHPVLSNATYELFSPNRETARAHIRNALEAVLTKPAFMSKRIFDAFVEDLERLSSSLAIPADESDSELRRYLEATYFRRLSPTTAESVFRSLWRVVFKTDDERCTRNRVINVRALQLLYSRSHDHFLERISADSSYYSDIGVSGNQLDVLIWFLSEHPRVFGVLNDAAKVLLNAYLKTNSEASVVAWFVSGDLRTHLDQVLPKLASENFAVTAATFAILWKRAKDENVLECLWRYAVEIYAASPSYDAADRRFQALLKPCLATLGAAELLNLLRGIEGNAQTTGRGRARTDHPEIQSAIQRVLGSSFDLSDYPRFVASLR